MQFATVDRRGVGGKAVTWGRDGYVALRAIQEQERRHPYLSFFLSQGTIQSAGRLTDQ